MTTPELTGQNAEDTPTGCKLPTLHSLHRSHGSFEVRRWLRARADDPSKITQCQGKTLPSEACTCSSLAVELAVHVRRGCQERGESVAKNQKLQAIVSCCHIYIF